MHFATLKIKDPTSHLGGWGLYADGGEISLPLPSGLQHTPHSAARASNGDPGLGALGAAGLLKRLKIIYLYIYMYIFLRTEPGAQGT